MSRTTDQAIDHQNAEDNCWAVIRQPTEKELAELYAARDLEAAIETVNKAGLRVVSPQLYALAMAKRGVN